MLKTELTGIWAKDIKKIIFLLDRYKGFPCTLPKQMGSNF